MNSSIEIIDYVMQYKISTFIKENKNMNKKDIVKAVEEMLNQKDEMYKMSEEELEKELKKLGMGE